jgi:adhesin transport system outer membrane protein
MLLLSGGISGCATTPPPAAPAPTPPSYAVLLENPDGSVGAVTIRGAKGEVVLERARTGADLDGGKQPYPVDEARMQRDFGAAIAARPPLPVSFLLYFEFGETRLTAESQALIPRIIEAVRARQAPDVSVIGHTDTVGDPEANEKLGLERAQAIAKLVAGAGLRAHDLTIASHGERDPLVRTPDGTPEPKNRRVEITIR